MKKAIFIFFLILISSLVGYVIFQQIDFKYYWALLEMDNQINNLFDWCVYVLIEAARLTNTTYEFVNILLFVVLMPLVIVLQLLLNIILFSKLKSINHEYLY